MAKKTESTKSPLAWDKPHDVDDVTLAFPACVVGTLLPPMARTPDDFRSRRSPWCRFFSSLFYKGGTLPSPKPGINAEKALRHLLAVMGSYEPKHEHKEAGAAWLMSLWYEVPEHEAFAPDHRNECPQ